MVQNQQQPPTKCVRYPNPEGPDTPNWQRQDQQDYSRRPSSFPLHLREREYLSVDIQTVLIEKMSQMALAKRRRQ